MGFGRTWVLAAMFFGISCCSAVAQNKESLPGVPDTASVKFEKELRLHPGQEFRFQLTLSPTPVLHPDSTQNNSRPRSITARFKRVGGGSSDTDEKGIAIANTPILDGQSIYNMTLDIQPWKLPGQWRLDSVSFNWAGERTLPIPGDVSFEMLGLEPISIRINAPPTVEAGKKYNFNVSIDKYPSDVYQGCVIAFRAQLGPDGVSNLDSFRPDEIGANKLTYRFSRDFEPDDRSGPWRLTVSEDEINEGYRERCGDREVRGERTFTFIVEPAKGVQIPTSVAVTVNPSQIQLLRGEADRLKAEADLINTGIASNSLTSDQLREKVQSALTALTATQARYIQKGSEQSSVAQANIFFGDIRRTYEDARKTLAEKSERDHYRGEPRPEYLNAALSKPDNPSAAPNPAAAVVRSAILRNVAAYEIVIFTKHLTFDLEVYSVPDGATIYYKRAGDEQETKVAHSTDWPIKDLIRAFYHIRCHKSGYEDLVLSFDAVDDSSSSLIFRLVPKADDK